jgi:hypothetical protein
LRLAWTRFSLSTSIAFVLALSGAAATSPIGAAALAQNDDAPRRANELTLAGLRPGRDTLAAALKRYKVKYATSDSGAPARSKTSSRSGASSVEQWLDHCTGRQLLLELDEHSVIQKITVSALGPRDGKCEDRRLDALDMMDWFTGHGLSLGDPRNRVTEMYGEPNSSEPSVKGNTELDHLYYSFDWAGDDIPQVFEIYCARDTGRVLEITLAFPRL